MDPTCLVLVDCRLNCHQNCGAMDTRFAARSSLSFGPCSCGERSGASIREGSGAGVQDHQGQASDCVLSGRMGPHSVTARSPWSCPWSWWPSMAPRCPSPRPTVSLRSMGPWTARWQAVVGVGRPTPPKPRSTTRGWSSDGRSNKGPCPLIPLVLRPLIESGGGSWT